MYSNNAQYDITVREQGQSKVYSTNCIYHKMLLTSAQTGSQSKNPKHVVN
jgi:hypothetical protein